MAATAAICARLSTGRDWRFADGRVTADGSRWIGVRERHDLGPAVAERIHAFLHGRPEDDDEVRDASLEDAGAGES